MAKGTLFWIIMILLLIGGLGGYFWGGGFSLALGGMSLIVWIVIALIGWKVFGPPIQ